MENFITEIITKIIEFALMALIVWGVWDPVMVSVFRFPDINYGQAIFVYILADTLFKANISVKQKD